MEHDEDVTPLERAIFIASAAHLGQTDKAGRPYILHCLRVMMRGRNDDERIVGVLHDVLEDTEVTAQELVQEGIPIRLVRSIVAISHLEDESEPLVDYIKRVRSDEIATAVKHYDIEDNADEDRLSVLDSATRERLRRKHTHMKDLLHNINL
jgi:GTP diphosphokinase / guanosine-3',5'-bis(diphosphate) 3'-diphosphatase